MKRLLLSLTMLFALVQISLAQTEAQVAPNPERISTKEVSARKSPMAIATLKKGDAYAKIVYCQPHLRGRKMLGETLPYGKLWRLGANEATEIFLTADLTIEGKVLKKGAYSLFATPEKDKWTLIFNKELGQWGEYTYKPESDVLKVDIPAKANDKTFEAFTIWFSKDGSTLNMAWDTALATAKVSF